MPTSRIRRSLRAAVATASAVAVALVALAGCSGGERDTAEPDGRRSGTTTTSATRAAPATTAPPVCDPPTTSLADGEQSITSGGVERQYLLALPTPFDPTAPVPVLLNFHGSGSDMNQQAVYSRFPLDATARGYVVVTPQGTGTPRGWKLGGGIDDVFVTDLLATLDAGACVDARRIFAAGISNGSAFSALMGCRAPYRIAAVGMVAATVPDVCPIERPIPAVAFHGTDDRVVPYNGGDINSRGADGARVPGAEGAIAQWAERNSCADGPLDSQLAPDVLQRSWRNCTDGADVDFYRIEGGGHTWPGGIDLASLGLGYLGPVTTSVSATTVILDFFDSHPMPADRLPVDR